MLQSFLAVFKSIQFWVTFGVGAVLGGLVVGVISYEVGFHKGNSYGYSRYVAEQAVKDHKAEKNRKADDAVIESSDDYAACVESLKRRSLPLDACEQLRGIHP